MRIFLDIGHPAHVHYFRNLIKLMQAKGHEFFISARDKEVTLELLEKYNISYINRGKGSPSLLGKFFYMLKADRLLLIKAKKFRPDLFLSFASPYASHIAWLTRKPHISFTDTENAPLGILSFAPFTECILTPDSFKKDFGKKHVRFRGFMELCYLHPNYFHPHNEILREVNLNEKDQFALIRFVSWQANHDIGQVGISDKIKIQLVMELRKKMKVFISSEGFIPNEIKEHKLQISPEKIHCLLSFATIYIGEGATMASECAMMGTPAIYINSLSSGTLEEQQRYGLVVMVKESSQVINVVLDLISDKNLREEFKKNQNIMLSNQIDVTTFMVWFIENYPDSFKTINNSSSYQSY
jgi:uncharacterized protein